MNDLQPERRFHELDALRGLAASTVVLLHFRNLFVPELWGKIPDERTRELMVWGGPLMTGSEAVVLFFVLSGFVLMLPYLKGRTMSYGRFFLRRVLRIYGPYVVALLLAVTGASLLHSKAGGTHGLQPWGDRIWSGPVSPLLVLEHVLMLGAYDWHQFNPAFWTLIVEMRVSLIFPLLAAAVMRLKVWQTGTLALLCSVVARMGMRLVPHADSVTGLMLEYVGMFLAGMALAKGFGPAEAWFRRQPRWFRVVAFVWVLALYLEAHRSKHGSGVMLTVGSAGLILVAVSSTTVRRMLQAGPLQVLGRWSYSLYLVHLPVLLTVAFLLAGRWPTWALLLLYLLLAVLLAGVFHRLVEAPFTELSRRVGSAGRNRAMAAERTKL